MNPEEIVYWLDNKSANRELLIFGCYAENRPVGYLQFSYYKKDNFACIDYAACEKEHRGLKKFSYTINFIVEYFKTNYADIDYLTTEIIKYKNPDMTRLLRRLNFMIANTLYIHPSLRSEEPKSVMNCNLLIYSYKMAPKIQKKDFLMIIKGIYDYSYIEWKKPFSEGIEYKNYISSINGMYDEISNKLGSDEFVVLV